MSWLPEDQALLTRFRAGDRRAMEAVYQHYAPKLSALVFRGLATGSGRVRVSTPYEVGAVVQETFARALQEKARLAYDGRAAYLSYLAAIARNHLLNERRVREEPVTTAALEVASSSGADGATVLGSAPRSPQTVAEENELAGLIARFLAGRDPRDRAVFKARFVEQRTQDDAAASVGLSRVQVRRIEAHLREDLLVWFKQNGYLQTIQLAPSSLLASPNEAER